MTKITKKWLTIFGQICENNWPKISLATSPTFFSPGVRAADQILSRFCVKKAEEEERKRWEEEARRKAEKEKNKTNNIQEEKDEDKVNNKQDDDEEQIDDEEKDQDRKDELWCRTMNYDKTFVNYD